MRISRLSRPDLSSLPVSNKRVVRPLAVLASVLMVAASVGFHPASAAAALAPAPTITSVTPNAGPGLGGTPIVIRGTGFAPGALVWVAGVYLGVGYVSPTEIHAVTPAGPIGLATVMVQNPDLQVAYSGFTYLAGPFGPPPSVSSVSPSSGPLTGGTPVVVSGANFSVNSVVYVGSSLVTAHVVSSSSLQLTVPAGVSAGLTLVTVVNPDGQVGLGTFTYSTGPFGPPPTVSSVSPSSGPLTGGTPVVVSGANFSVNSVVYVGGSLVTAHVVSASSLQLTVPAGVSAGLVAVTVVNPDGQVGSGSFTYSTGPFGPPPIINLMSPGAGPLAGGTPVAVFGTGFTPDSVVYFAGTQVPATVVSPSLLQVTTPAVASLGPVDVSVVNPDGQVAHASFSYANPIGAPPGITSVSPNSGPVTGGTQVTLALTGFSGGGTFYVGGVLVTPTSQSGSGVTFTTPPSAAGAGAVAVVLVNPDGQVATSQFTYLSPQDTTPPVITVPADISVPAMSMAGAAVPFSVSATDNVDALVTPTCATVSGPVVSGAIFPIGITNVTCNAVDAAGNHAVAKGFSVTVQTPAAPTFGPTTSVMLTAAGAATSATSVVSLPRATDAFATDLPVSCQDPGNNPVLAAVPHTFALGVNVVKCSTLDAVQQSASVTFTVTVVRVPGLPPVVNVSPVATRAGSIPLVGQALIGPQFITTSGPGGIKSVTYWVDNAKPNAPVGTPYSSDELAPFDLVPAGGTAAKAMSFNVSTLSLGSHRITALVTYANGASIVVQGLFKVTATPISALYFSKSANRSSPVSLAGKKVVGNIAIFLAPAASVSSASFYLDAKKPTAPKTGFVHKATAPPYDFVKTAGNGTAVVYNASKLKVGKHTITVVIRYASGKSQTLVTTFTR